MTRRSIVTQGDLKRMATIAKTEGVTVWIEMPDGTKIVVSPGTVDQDLKTVKKERIRL